MSVTVPGELKNFHKLFMDLLSHGIEARRGFDDLLEYIMMGHIIDNSMEWTHKYSKKEIYLFYALYCEWLKVLQVQLVSDRSWYDLWGTYYEAVILSKMGREGSGQFFTPGSICDFMAEVTGSKDKIGQRVGDPSCGSGRCLLSYHVQNPGCFMVGEDVDRTCALMAVLNFMSHGVNGLVIWGNSLTKEVYEAWRINEHLNLFQGVPHIRHYNLEEAEKAAETLQEQAKEKVTGPVTLDDFKVEAKGCAK